MYKFLLITCIVFSMVAYAESERVYRKITLENGLKVVLVSDPDVNNSSASIDVKVGSLADPKNRQGLAHFFEHMLFLGTEKYPVLNEYGEYLKSRGGYSNAYTDTDHTNYHFQITHEGLPEALDRFAQFFISPLLTQKYAQREMRAVHSEHQKNIPQDPWRLMQLRRSMFRKDHPGCAFHTGSLETLEGTTQEELQQFLEDYYSPEVMALSIISKYSLDQLEKLAREKFSGIKTKTTKPFSVSPNVLDKKDALRLVRVVPVMDIRQLQLFFPLGPYNDEKMEKTKDIIGMTMGDEGSGSLLSLLKEQNLATTLSAGVGSTNRFYSSCSVSIDLTQKGLENYEEVLKLCFSYLQLLKTSEFPMYIWEEMKTMAELREKYSPKGEGTSEAIRLAHNANERGLAVAERYEYIFTAPNKRDYQKILAELTPDNLMVFLVAKGLTTDQEEPWYKINYGYEESNGELYQALKNSAVHPKLHLPKPNPFVPKDTQVLGRRPVLLVENEAMTVWYSQDTEFKRPKVSLYAHILSPRSYSSVADAVLIYLYIVMIQEKLNEFSYPALMAGLSYQIAYSKQGVLLTIQGYSESSLKLLEVVSKELKSTDYSEEMFATVKDTFLRDIQNFEYSQATDISREASRKLNLKRYYTPDELLPVLEKTTLADFQKYIGDLFAEAHIQGLCHGNLTADQVKTAFSSLASELKAKPFSPKNAFVEEVLWLGEENSDTTVYKKSLETNNSCLRMEYQVGKADFATQAAAQIIDLAIRNAFYTEMRTKQMLGYIVFSGTYSREKVQTFTFIIQSGTHDSGDLFQRADTFIQQIPEIFAALPEQQFETIRESIIKGKRQKLKSIAEVAAVDFDLAFNKERDFEYRKKEIKALQEVTKEQALELTKQFLGEKTRRRIVILLNAKQHDASKLPEGISNVEEFHQKCSFVR